MNLPQLPKERRQRLMLVGAGIAVLVGAWLASAAGSVSRGRSQALAGLNRLEAVREEFEIESLNSGELNAELAAAADEFASAQSTLRAPWVTPLRIVPWAGTQIRSADALSGSAATVAQTLAAATDEVLAIEDATQARTINKAEASSRLLSLTRETRTTLSGLELGPATGLVGSLANARARFEQELVDVELVLSDAETALEGMTEFLTGPTTYLLLSANTAEMRAGFGRFLLAGPMEVRDGDVELGDLQEPGRSLAELVDLGQSPRFEVSASAAAAIWEQNTGQAVDGVLVLDPVALASVIGEESEILIDGLTLESSRVLSYVLFDQYWELDRDTRKQRQQDLAETALSATLGPDVDLVELARSVRAASQGRHILAWSESPAQQAAWEAAGVDGLLGKDSLMISLINEGRSKLDTFIRVGVEATSSNTLAGTQVSLDITVSNEASPVLPDYVIGPFEAVGVERAGYPGTLVATLPGAARDVEISAGAGRSLLVDDGPSKSATFAVEVAAGATGRYAISFTLPNGSERLTVEPSARVPEVSWEFDGSEWFDTAPRVLDFESGNYGVRPSRPVANLDGLGRVPIVPPTPEVVVVDDQELEVTWRALPADATFVLWQKNGEGDWFVIDPAAPASGSRRIELQEGGGQPCFRTSLAGSDTAFSSADCLVP
jgi:hypothetical protein